MGSNIDKPKVLLIGNIDQYVPHPFRTPTTKLTN